MVLKAACTLLVVFTLAVVLTNQNDAEDSPIEVGGPATNRATSETKSDPQDEVQRLRRSFDDIKAHVAIRLRECQGLPMGFSDTVVSAEERESDQSYRLTPLPQMNRKRLPLRVSREEEEWMRLAGELHAENCVELLLN